MKTLIILACLTQDWEFEAKSRVWIGDDTRSRTRALEIEGLGKGGNGQGTLFSYEEVGSDQWVGIPEAILSATYRDRHRFTGSFSYSAKDGETTLDKTIEYDGDLHRPGERIESEFSVWMASVGYAYKVKDDLFDQPLDLWIGADVIVFSWEGVLRTVEAGPVPPSDIQSNEVITGLYLPVLKASLEYSNDPLTIRASAAWMYGATSRRGIASDQNLTGYCEILLGAEYKISRHFAVTADAGYRILNAISFEHKDEADYLGYRLLGATLGVSYRF